MMFRAVARYREFAPCEALREQVRAFFSFQAPAQQDSARRRITRELLIPAGDPFWSGLFADGQVSMVFSFASGYCVDGLWDPSPAGPRGHVIGDMSAGHATSPGDSLETIGVYFRAAQAPLFMQVPARELTDRIVALEDLWGIAASELEAELSEAHRDDERIARLESALL